MRKLASIQRIDKLNKIKNADSLESAKILGWNVVVLIGDFKVGDLCIYCEVDSILPEKEELVLNHTVEDLVTLSYGKSKLNPKRIREGIIIRSQTERFDEEVGRLSFKVISPKFLLKYKK